MSDLAIGRADDRRQKAVVRMRRWRQANPEKARALNQRTYQNLDKDKKRMREAIWRQANRERAREASRRWKLAHPDRIREKHKKQRYNMTQVQWDALFVSQGSCCAICMATQLGGPGWNTDHCHSANMVRGILCSACNLALGLLKDDVRVLYAAAAYIERANANKGEIQCQTPFG